MSYLFTSPVFRPLTAAGEIMPGAYVQFYLTGTTTPTDVYADADLGTPLSNPVVADSAGQFVPIYMDPSITYRGQLYDADGNLQWDVDPLAPPRDYPAGTTFMFMGDATARDAAYPLALWAVCDGTNGTYDLRGRIPIGVSASIDPGEAVGTDPGGSVTTSTDGAHDHSGATSATAISEAQMPAHQHRMLNSTKNGTSMASAPDYSPSYWSDDGGDSDYFMQGQNSAPTLGLSGVVGSGDTHDHDISSDGDHSHTVATALPPCVGIWFVCRKA